MKQLFGNTSLYMFVQKNYSSHSDTSKPNTGNKRKKKMKNLIGNKLLSTFKFLTVTEHIKDTL